MDGFCEMAKSSFMAEPEGSQAISVEARIRAIVAPGLLIYKRVCEMDSCTIVFQVFIPAKLAFKGRLRNLPYFFIFFDPGQCCASAVNRRVTRARLTAETASS